MRDFDGLSIAELRKRRSAKCTMFPPDVLPAWVAEMDFPLADAVRNALLDSIEHDDCGYANGVLAYAVEIGSRTEQLGLPRARRQSFHGLPVERWRHLE